MHERHDTLKLSHPTEVLEILKLELLSMFPKCLFRALEYIARRAILECVRMQLNKWKPKITVACLFEYLPNACTKPLGNMLCAVMLRSVYIECSGLLRVSV